MQVHDLVIIVAKVRQAVVEVSATYFYATPSPAFPERYRHQRPFKPTELDADKLWSDLGGKNAVQGNIYTPLVRLESA
jgi:hypothetical protein